MSSLDVLADEALAKLGGISTMSCYEETVRLTTGRTQQLAVVPVLAHSALKDWREKTSERAEVVSVFVAIFALE